MTKSSQERGFKKTLQRMLRRAPMSNDDVAKRVRSPSDPDRKVSIRKKRP